MVLRGADDGVGFPSGISWPVQGKLRWGWSPVASFAARSRWQGNCSRRHLFADDLHLRLGIFACDV